MKRSGGFSLVELLVVILIISTLIALVTPNFALMQERARRTAVRDIMHTLHVAMQAYAADNSGRYPTVGALSGKRRLNPPPPVLACYFPGGDPVGTNGEPTYARLPTNPYTGLGYNTEEYDMDYDSYFGELTISGAHAQCLASDDDCPYIDFCAPRDIQGTICVASYVREGNPFEFPEQYGIFGFGQDFTLPMFDFVADDRTGARGIRFFVLHN